MAIYAQDQCGSVEIAEHDRNTPVRREMGMRLIARSAEIEVGDPVGRDHAEGVIAFGAEVDAGIFGSGGAAKDGVMVPQDAVQTVGDRTVVFVRTANGFKATNVEVGSRSGGLVAIVSGLKAGTPIATINAFLLKAELEKESAE